MHDFRVNALQCHARIVGLSQLYEEASGGPFTEGSDCVGSVMSKKKSPTTWKRRPKEVQLGRPTALMWIGLK